MATSACITSATAGSFTPNRHLPSLGTSGVARPQRILATSCRPNRLLPSTPMQLSCSQAFHSTGPNSEKRPLRHAARIGTTSCSAERGDSERSLHEPLERATDAEMRSQSALESEPSIEEGKGGSLDSVYALSALALVLLVGSAAVANPADALTTLHPKSPIDTDMTALALGPGGPLVEEFWENVSRYIAYFFTVASGGLYTLVKPIGEMLQKPATAVFVIGALSGAFFLMYLTLGAMLGLDPSSQSQYQF